MTDGVWIEKAKDALEIAEYEINVLDLSFTYSTIFLIAGDLLPVLNQAGRLLLGRVAGF